tara:strand:- start:1513 stop:2982 length:1470 start_codon:yes stop_codon:yes gene_type:complete
MTLDILPVDETYVRLSCDMGLLQEISDNMTFEVPGAKFMPKYKMGIWDGKIRLVNRMNGTIYKGLVPHIINFCQTRDYNVNVSKSIVFPFKDTINFKFSDLKLKEGIVPHDFQEEALKTCLTKKRQIIVSPTASGKSLIIYGICRALEKKKTLIIVPTVGLVNQMVNDFEDYASADDSWNADENCHKIYSGQEKDSNKQIYVSTWQSVWKKGKKYFSQFDCIIGDEVHTFDAKACTSILEKTTNAFYRFGFTGTLRESKTHELTLSGLFGPVTQMVTTKELMDRNVVAKMQIDAIVLKYSEQVSKTIRGAKYHEEIDFIVTSEARNRFLTKLTSTREGNTLILFNFVDKHGVPMYEMMKDALKDTHEVHFVYGGTDSEQREKVRQLVSRKSNLVIIASYGVFSTGINMVNLHTVVLSSPTKSKVRVLQSIGRGLRKSSSKTKVNIIDIADDLRGNRKTKNYSIKHFNSRYDMYINEGFDVNLHTYNITG